MIYLAGSWKATGRLDTMRDLLRDHDHEVYDFREHDAFHWSDVDPSIEKGAGQVMDTPAANFRQFLYTSPCAQGFARDMANLVLADTVLLVLPCGKSAHFELGYAFANQKKTIVWLTPLVQPELMYFGLAALIENPEEALGLV